MDGILFKIDGDDYVFDSADSLTMDEAIILHDYSGLTIDQIEDVEGFNPKVAAAFMHIAVARKRPDLKQTQIRKLVGAVKLDELAEAFAEAEEQAASQIPPEHPPSENEASKKLGGNEKSSGGNGQADGVLSLDASDLTSTGTRA